MQMNNAYGEDENKTAGVHGAGDAQSTQGAEREGAQSAQSTQSAQGAQSTRRAQSTQSTLDAECDAGNAPVDDAGSTRELAQASKDSVALAGRDVQKGDVVKFIALVVTLLLMLGVVFALWPTIKDIFSEGGVSGLVDTVKGWGPLGVLILLLLQFLQVLVAFIPGEAVQFAAGALYGPIGGSLLILAGCALSSAAVYVLVHKLGAPFVQTMVSEKYLDKFREFEHSGKLAVLVFVIYLIPGLPKDTFSYLVPLTNMKLKSFIGITTVARTPGVLASCFVANGLMQGNYVSAAIVAAVVVVLVVLCIWKRKELMEWLRKISQ